MTMSKPVLLYHFFKWVICPLFKLLDLVITKHDKCWAFTVHHIKSDQFIENQRAVFDHIKNDDSIEKLIFLRNNREKINLDVNSGRNIRVVHLGSIAGLYEISRCKVVFVSHSIAMDYSLRWPGGLFAVPEMALGKRIVVNLWHATSFKKLLALTSPAVRFRTDRSPFRRKERKYYAGLIASSDIDRYAMAAMFHPIHPDHVWVTGLPRVDYLFRSVAVLPEYVRSQIERLKELKQGRRLITYAPTYRQTSAVAGAEYYQFSDGEIERLKTFCAKYDLIFGFRMHYFRNDRILFNMEQYVDNETIIDLGHGMFSEMAAVTRCSDGMITDYSSVFIEALCVDIPVFCFAYDFEHYGQEQDGILYDFEVAFPGPIVKNFNSLIQSLESEMTAPEGQMSSDRYKIAKKMFYKYQDGDNARRVVNQVKRELKVF